MSDDIRDQILFALTVALVVIVMAVTEHIRDLNKQITIIDESISRAVMPEMVVHPTGGTISCDCRVVP